MMPRLYFKLEEVLKTQPGKTEIHNHINNTILSLEKTTEKVQIPDGDKPTYEYDRDIYHFIVERVVDGKRQQILRTEGYSLAEQMQALTSFMSGEDPLPLEVAEKHLKSQQWSDLLYEQERTAHNKRHSS